jgi:hypothetical protein
MSSLFEKVATARPNDFGRYIEQGKWKFLIQAVKEVKPRSGGEAFTVELKVLETDNPNFRVGEAVSWQCHSKHDSAPSNIRHFIANAMNCEFDEVDSAGYQAIVSAENPLGGTVIYALGTNILTRANKPFTKVRWSLHPFTAEQVAEEAAKA